MGQDRNGTGHRLNIARTKIFFAYSDSSRVADMSSVLKLAKRIILSKVSVSTMKNLIPKKKKIFFFDNFARKMESKHFSIRESFGIDVVVQFVTDFGLSIHQTRLL